jgi:hypothetical protein
MMEERSFDTSHPIVHANHAPGKDRRGDHKAVKLNASKVQILPLNSTGEEVSAARTVTAGRYQSTYWMAALECFIEGFALYGASIHPTAHFIVRDHRASSAMRHSGQEVAFGDWSAHDTHPSDDDIIASTGKPPLALHRSEACSAPDLRQASEGLAISWKWLASFAKVTWARWRSEREV